MKKKTKSWEGCLVLLAAMVAFVAAAISAAADGKTFTLAGADLKLEEVTPDTGVLFSSMRWNRGANTWNFEVSLTNQAPRALSGPFVLVVESYTGSSGPLKPDGVDEAGRAYFDLSATAPAGRLEPGQRSLGRTLSLGFRPGAVPAMSNRVYALPQSSQSAAAFVRTLNEAGHPLPGVTVEETGPLGMRTITTESVFGVATLGQAAGAHTWKFSLPGHLPVWRQLTLGAGAVAVVADPRLTRQNTSSTSVSPGGGVRVTSMDGSIQLDFRPGTVFQNGAVVLTPLTSQTLPGFLPQGWSPMQALWVDFGAAAGMGAEALLRPWGPLAAGEAVALVRWSESALRWQTAQLLSGNGTNSLPANLPIGGAYALVVVDSGPGAPASATVGQALSPGTLEPPESAALTAGGAVDPSIRSASRLAGEITAFATVVFTNWGGAMPSGVIFQCEITESYRLRGGGLRHTPAYENHVVAYRRPGTIAPNALQARFPLRPLLLFGPEELEDADVKVDVLSPQAFSGAVFEPSGGVIAAGGWQVSGGAGDVQEPQAARLRQVDPALFAEFSTNSLGVVGAFELSVARVAPGRGLRLQSGSLPPTNQFVLARVLYDLGFYGLQPVERLRSDSQGRLLSAEPADGVRLSGLAGSGQYLLLRLKAPQGLVAGIARNSAGQPAAGMPVQIAGQPWLAFSGANGSFLLLAPTGTASVGLTDLSSGDTGLASLIVSGDHVAVLEGLSTMPTGPRVLTLEPTNGAVAVPRVAPVVVTFSEPVNIGTLTGGGLRLVGASNATVNASLSLNLAGTVATLLPMDPLAPGTRFTILLSSNIADTAGNRLEGPNSYAFTTVSDLLDRSGAQLTSYEPVNGAAGLVGAPGTAEPNAPVILVNETSGRTGTVLSRPDGSFSNSIPAEVDDTLTAVMVNGNGTRNQIPVSRQIFADGRVGLFSGGGVVEARTPDGPAQIVVEPNAIPNKTVVKVDYLAPANFPTNVAAQPPDGGKLYGALQVAVSGDQMKQSMDVVLPVRVETLGLPAGEDPTNATFALVIARELDDIDGERKTVYEIIDRMHYEDGRLVTHSPPFPGLMDIVNGGWSLIIYAALQGTGGNLGVAGRVYAQSASNKETRRFLPGAVVSVIPPNTALPGIRGRLRPGSMFAFATGSEANYAAIVPVYQSGSTILQARHPAFPGQVATLAVPSLTPNQRFVMGNILHPMDLVFPLPPSSHDLKPPAIAFAHSPQLPDAGSNGVATLRIVAVDNSSRPSLIAEVDEVKPFQATNILAASVVLTVITNEDLGALGRRATVEARCSVPARVVFKATSADEEGNSQSTFYSILFGAGSPVISNHVPLIDPNDHRGPAVIASDPAPGALSVAPGQMITLTFSEPIDRGVLQLDGVVNLFPKASPPSLSLSEDQRELSITVYNLGTDADYSLTLSGVKDLSGNPLDQDPTLGGDQSYTLGFHTAPLPTGDLRANSGGGVVSRGIYAYALERRDANGAGALKVFDLSNPAAPTNVANLALPNGYPRDLALVPQYSFKYRTNDEAHVTRDLLLIVGGFVGQGQAQYLRVVDITNPRNPTNLLGRVLSFSPDSVMTRLQWSAPYLGYLDAATVPSIGLVNLQTLIISEFLSLQEFKAMPEAGFAGVDSNGDGDYVDPGDEMPLPERKSPEFAGKVMQLGFGDTDQNIRDFALENGGGFLGVISDRGHLFGTDGKPTGEAAEAAYTTLMAGGDLLERKLASYEFPHATLHRLKLLFNQSYAADGGVEVKDLALISLRMNASFEDNKTNRIAVLDVTIPTNPRLMAEIPISLEHGNGVWSLIQRDDGMILAAGDRDVILLNPAKFGETALTNDAALHPAIAGVIPGAGVSMRTFAGNSAGFNLASDATKNRLYLTPPQFRFVSFPGVAPFSVQALIAKGAAKMQETLDKAQIEQELRVARLLAGPSSPSSLSPPDAAVHYYTLIHAPGSAGETVEIALESLNRAGYPLKNRGFLFPPVRAVDAGTAEILGQKPKSFESPVRSCRAWRLSNDPADPDYNLYLSRPFVLVFEEAAVPDLARLQAELDREILWSGSFLRASFDLPMSVNSVIGGFASRLDSAKGVIAPGASVMARTLPGDYIMGPNPNPILGGVAAPAALGALGAHNGDLMLSTVDITLPGRRLPIEFRRSGSSQGLFEGPFGRGWDFNFNQRIVELREGVFPSGARMALVTRENAADSEFAQRADVVFHNGAGRAVVYRYFGETPPPEVQNDPLVVQLGWISKAARFYSSAKGVFSILLKMKDGRFVRLEPDGGQTWYGPDGRLDVIYDRYEKNSLACRYNLRGELVRILDELERPLEIGYWRLNGDPDYRESTDAETTNPEVAGLIARLQDYTGRDVLFFYTEEGLLQRREGPLVTVAAEGGFRGRQITSYYHSGVNDPARSAQSARGMLSGSDSGTPLLAATEVGVGGRDVVTKMSAGGKEIAFSMSHSNKAAAVSRGNAASKLVGADKSTTDYQFDKYGRPLEVRLGKEGETTEKSTFQYNDHGLVRLIVFPEGNSEEFNYDENNPAWRSRGNLLSIVKKPGPRGGPALISSSTYDAAYNQPLTKTDYNGNVATFFLRGDRRDAETIAIHGETERYARNDMGQLVGFTTPDNIIHQFHYNAEGYLDWKMTGSNKTEYVYSGKAGKLGLPSTVRDPRGFETSFTYDERNQAVTQDQYGYRVENSYDERGFVGRVATRQDENVIVTEINTYDQLGFKLIRTIQDAEVGGRPTNLVTQYLPDDVGRIRKVLMPGGEVHETQYDQAGRVSQYKVGDYVEDYAYDRNGNITTNRIGDAMERYIYDGHNRLLQVVSPNGGITEYEYDGNNNLKRMKVVDPLDGIISDTSYEVDHRNRYKTVTRVGGEGNSVVTYGYRPLDRQFVMTDALNQVVTTTFDEAGRLQSHESPTRLVKYAYDGNGNLTRKESSENGRAYVEESEYNERNQLVLIRDSLANKTTFTLGFDGRVLTSTDRDGNTTTNSHNSFGEVVSRQGANGTLVRISHTANREIESITDLNGDGITHTFDSMGRLVKTRHANGSETIQSEFDPRNAPRKITLPGGVTVLSSFDREGKLLTRTIEGSSGSRLETYRHDVTGRLREIRDPTGGVEYLYDKLGYAKQIVTEQNGYTYVVSQKGDSAGFRKEVQYPSGLVVQNLRDATGRLSELRPDDAPSVLEKTIYASDSLPGVRTLGSNMIAATLEYDALKRPTARRYSRVSDGALLAEVRYAYSKGGAQVARQFLHRAGRADFFQYDGDHRLIRGDFSVRPRLSSESARSLAGFQKPAGLEGDWAAGKYAREFAYTRTDVLRSSALINPDGLATMPFATNYSAPTASLQVLNIDGVVRTLDAAGNATSGRLWVRLPGASIPAPVDAIMQYNDLGQLVRVTRADGVTVENRYGPGGLRIRRLVTGNPALCEPSDMGFVYDGGNLIEERDLGDGNKLIARYYYGDDGDELLAGDILDRGGSGFHRFYFLTDGLRSVMAVADSAGNVVERVNYDAWGQPEIQSPDTQPPRVSDIRSQEGSLLVRFSEPILPVFDRPSSNLVSALRDVQSVLEVRNAQAAIRGTVAFIETNSVFGTTLRFTPDSTMNGTVTLRIPPGCLQDEWNNANPGESLEINVSAPPGSSLYAGPAPGGTASANIARSAVKAPFLFHGQVFDYETGLIYCRARFYDPGIGLFLQRDPSGYEDSVNHYAGFKNNPVNFRDPTGMATDEAGAWLSNIGQQADLMQDGLIGVAYGAAFQFIGSVLQLGTGTAEGFDRLEHVRSGTLGMLDIMQGAGLIAGDVAVFSSATSMGSSIGITAKRRYGSTIKAYTLSAYECSRDLIAQKTGRRTGYGVASRYGFQTGESTSIHRTLQDYRQMGKEIEITIRMGSDYEKGGMRRRWVSQGYQQKRAVDKKGKTGRDARLLSPFDKKTVVVSDLDIAGIKENGKLTGTKGYVAVESAVGRHYSNYFEQRRQMGSTLRPNPPFQHHGAFQVSEQYGKQYLGDALGLGVIEALGHPGHTVTFRLDAKGNLLVHRTPGWSVDMDILRTEMSLRRRMAELSDGENAFLGLGAKDQSMIWALPKSWHSWKD